ncbi:EKC/KEOPS complex subunit Bud32p [Diutina catenulata]
MTDKIIAEAQQWLPNIPLTVVSQGAEAIVFETPVAPFGASDRPLIVKYRPHKPYRHPKLDKSIIKNRTAGEARMMDRLNRLGVNGAKLVSLDVEHGIIWMEQLGTKLNRGEPSSLKNVIWQRERQGGDCLADDIRQLFVGVGEAVGRLHLHNCYHGDLTSSNIIIHEGQPYLIDFGLSEFGCAEEDQAVDIYVLERAILSTHSQYSDYYIEWFHQGYAAAYASDIEVSRKQPKDVLLKLVLKRLADVRLRGRKRSMMG